MYRLWIVLVLMTSGFALPLRATDDRPSAPIAASESTAADPAPASGAGLAMFPRPAVEPSRSRALVPMYAGTIGLQAYDAYSTLAAIRAHAVEMNPVVAPIARNPAAFIAAKAIVSTVTLAMSERLWRDGHRGRALVLMAVSNGLMAAVAARNASVLRSSR